MTSQEITVTDESYQAILAHEDKTARLFTSKIVEKPKLSFWMFLIPIVFIPYMQQYQKYKESVKVFSSGYMYTKKIALDTAYKLFKNEIRAEDAPAILAKIVYKDPQANPKILKIYQKQLREVEVLCKHYSELLATKKSGYREMLVSNYQTEANYRNFANILYEAEKDVLTAASANLKDKTAETLDIMVKMKDCLLELKLADAKQFFVPE